MGIVFTENLEYAAVPQDRAVGFADLLADAQSVCTATGSLFIESGLRAARASRSVQRASILRDMANVLGCAPHELEFLFFSNTLAPDAANDSDPVVMPDYADALRGGTVSDLAAE